MREKTKKITPTRQSLAKDIATKNDLTMAEASALVNDVFQEISKAFESGEDVKISKFGRFSVNATLARIARNPKTKVPAKIPNHNGITFKPSPKMVSDINVNPGVRSRSKSSG